MADEEGLALYKSGMGKFVQQDFEGALADFGRALALDPGFGDVIQSIAHVYEKLDDMDKALEYAKRAVQAAPHDFMAHTSLSMFYQRTGNIPEAEKELAIAAELQGGQG
jgi:Tfp pilus assembly protein PilF